MSNLISSKTPFSIINEGEHRVAHEVRVIRRREDGKRVHAVAKDDEGRGDDQHRKSRTHGDMNGAAQAVFIREDEGEEIRNLHEAEDDNAAKLHRRGGEHEAIVRAERDKQAKAHEIVLTRGIRRDRRHREHEGEKHAGIHHGGADPAARGLDEI